VALKKLHFPNTEVLWKDIAGELFRFVTENFELTFDHLVAISNDGFPSM
jgi:hypothetical protein